MDLDILFSYSYDPNTNILFIDVIILMNINLRVLENWSGWIHSMSEN